MMPYARFVVMNLVLGANLWALLHGGGWLWASFLLTAGLASLLDELLPDDSAVALAPDAPATRFLDAMLYLTLPLMAANLAALAHLCGSGDPVGWVAGLGRLGIDIEAARAATGPWSLLGGIYAFGLATGAAATNVAHELVHRTHDRAALLAGRWLLAFSFDTTFSIEHVYGHHRRVGTWDDPATARRFENAWAFIWRSTRDGNCSAWGIERERLARKGLPLWSAHNRCLTGQLMSLALAGLAAFVGGWLGLLVFLVTAAQGKSYLEVVDYIEHYGLVRLPGMPVEARHAWDSRHWYSASALYNLPRHSHHHMFAAKPFWKLESEAGAPQMPYGYMTMIALALVPPLWRRLMHPRLAVWDAHMASAGERQAVAERGWALEQPSMG
jgi:alkane 1-monooxygenase